MTDINQLIQQTHEKPQARALLLQALLHAELYCLGEAQSLGNAEDEMELLIAEWEDESGNAFIPCFATMDDMEDFVEDDEAYLCLNGKVLLELCADTTIIINPESELEFVLSPDEIVELLEG